MFNIFSKLKVQKEKRVSISNPEQVHKASYYHQHPEHIEYDKEL